MIGLVIVGATSYVMGTKAGHRRYEQISRNYRRIADSPTAKKLAGVARERLVEVLSTERKLPPIELQPIDAEQTVYVPRR
ncbi:MAG: hypothetical protein ACXVGI_00615 [Mycobacteriaceae bacterium]